jgi:Domain of unknown function (DUF4184)
LLSALVVGAIAPDLHYFLSLAPAGKASHSIAGAFYLDLPSALLVLCLFHRLLKLPLISLAPEWHQARLVRFTEPFRFWPWRRFGLILVSLLAGIFSHLLWDSFTHNHGWMVQHIAVLRAVPFQQLGNYRAVYNLLQYLSTLLGVLALAAGYVHWSRRATPQAVPQQLKLSPRVKTSVVVVIGIAAAIVAVAYALDAARYSTRPSTFVVYATISFTTLIVVGLLVFSVYWHRAVRSTA